MRILLATLASLLLALPAGAGQLDGVTLPDGVQVEGQALVLNGIALRKKAFIKVYVAGLYLPTKEGDAERVLAADATRRLVMQFLRGVGKGSLCDAWNEGLEDNTPDPSAELRRQFEQLCEWMADVSKGDRFVFTYVPGQGTSVEVKGKVAGKLPGKAFADALFASWIGPDPGPGEKFKRDLLGG